MDEQEIKNEVLEAENIIRGLAHRMKDANAALETAEAARLGMADARTALHGSAAQLDNLHRMAAEALSRVEEATKGLVEQTGKSLEAATGEMGKGVQELQETRTVLLATAQNTQQAAAAVLERDNETTEKLTALAATLPAKVAESTAAALQSLKLDLQQARESGDALHAHFEHTRTEVNSRLQRNEASMGHLEEALQKQAVFLEETAAFLTERLQEARNETSSRFSDLEGTLLARIERNGAKATWIVVLQILLMLAASVAGFFAAKAFLHF